MTSDQEKQNELAKYAPLQKFFGTPPVLASENINRYEAIMQECLTCLKPNDFLEQIFVKDLVDATWEILRVQRHKKWAIEETYRQHQENRAQRQKTLELMRADIKIREEPKESTEPPSEVDRVHYLESEVDWTIKDIDDLATRPIDFDYARALKASFGYHEQLDRLLNRAYLRRNEALGQLEWYRNGLGKDLRAVTGNIIEAEFSQTALLPAHSPSPAEGNAQ